METPATIEPTPANETRRSASEAVQARVMMRLGRAMERAPWSVCRATGARFGMVFFTGFKRRRQMAVDNVRFAFPHLNETQARRIARRSAQNFGMTFCEFLHLNAASPQEISEYGEIVGLEHIEKGFEAGRGVLLATAHFGNWEVMGARAVQEFPMTVIVRLTSNRALREHVESVRARVNIGMILKNEQGRAALNVLRANEALAIFPDQHAGVHGALLPFFGHPTRWVASLSRLAMVSGAPMVPGYGVRREPWMSDGRVLIQVRPGHTVRRAKGEDREAAVLEGTRFVISETERIIRQHPDQWLWAHRRWRPKDLQDLQDGG